MIDVLDRDCHAPGEYSDETQLSHDTATSEVDSAWPTPTSSDDLQILVQQGEGTTLEYKESLSDSFARELVALANTRGGKILLGVRDDGTIAGASDSNRFRARIQDIARNCDPRVVVALEPVDRVIVVHVRESGGKPVQCREGFFSREGAATQKLSRDELRNFFRREGAVRFDTSFEARFRFPEDFDFDKFELWRSLSGVTAAASVEDVLVNLEVAERSPEGLRVHNGGVLFFARKPRRFFNQAYITCILFRGTGRVDIIDRKDLDGGLVADVEESLRFIERNTRTAYRIKSLKRQDIPEYPMTALREAIVNAVIHRDWFVYGANVFVEIHADRIDIVSPGGLFGGVTPDLLGRKAVRRNPLLADLFQRIGFIEKAGTGIERMRQDVKAHGSPEPVFVADTFFTATFRPLRAMEFGHLGPDGHERAHDGAHDGAHDPPLTDSERLILEACGVGGVTRSYLMQFGKFAGRSGNFTRAMTRLLTLGLIEMTLPEKPRSRNQRYRATAKGRQALAALCS